MKTPILNFCHVVGVALPEYKNCLKVKHKTKHSNKTSTVAKYIMNKY